MSIHKAIRERLLSQAGLVEPAPAKYDFDKLKETEWSPRFEQLMRNRLLMGALRYGSVEEKRKKNHNWDLIGAVEKKITLYNKTGNTEYLVDIANYCLLEFEIGNHPNKHFHALDNHHDHCRKKKQ